MIGDSDRESAPELTVRTNVSLAPLTTLELGGSASSFVDADSVGIARDAVNWAGRHDQSLAIFGGGSNVVVADDGFTGLVVRVAMRGVEVECSGDTVRVTAAAGESWDELVELSVTENLAGLECLSGIPGWVGATPIQNVGAYGQDVSQTIESVRVLDLSNLEDLTFEPERCGFGYRTSTFREFPGRYLVLAVTFALLRGGKPRIEYQELRRALGIGGASASLTDVRQAVLELRRGKSMVIDKNDPNRRSAGSFFVNPVIDGATLALLDEKVRSSGRMLTTDAIPTFAVDDGQYKIPAAWLIEKAGFSKGMRRGSVGISSAHALAVVHHGGGTTSELLALVRDIREGVRREFDIELQPEPVFVGFPTPNPLDF